MQEANRFASLMRLTALDSGEGHARFMAPEAPEPSGRMFGGQLLAHGLMAGYETVAEDRFVHSLHGYFLRAGDVDQPTELVVENVRDGRSFSARNVVARQEHGELFRASLSFHVPEVGSEFQPLTPPSVPKAESIEVTYNDLTREWRADLFDDQWAGEARPIDIRYVNPPTAPEGVAITENQLMWTRVPGSLGSDRRLHDVALAYQSDATLVDHVHLPHGRRWQDPRANGASLDHSMWFHRPARGDEWLLFEQGVEFTGGNRGLASGRFYTETGDLVATCMQEGLMRWAD